MDAIKDAKIKFIETGRLNRKVVRDEIALSWYKCQLNHLSVQKYRNMEDSNAKKNSIESIIPKEFDYYFTDSHLKVIHQRTDQYKTGTWESLNEHEVGTNAASLTLKYEKIFYVKNEEHFLECFSKVNTLGIPIYVENEIVSILMLVSNRDITLEDYQSFISKIACNPILFQSNLVQNKNPYTLHSSLFLTEDTVEKVELMMKDFLDQLKPILIYGGEKTGKSTLAWEIYIENTILPYVFNCKEIPTQVQEKVIKDLIQTQDYLIVENIEYATEKVQSIFTAAIDRNFNVKEHLTGFIFISECKNNLELKARLSSKLYERLNTFSLSLPCFSQMQGKEKELLLTSLLKQNNIECFKMEQNSILEICNLETTKTLLVWISSLAKSGKAFTKNNLIHCKTKDLSKLSDYENEYILDVYHRTDENITLTCELLNISRSTFYRKIDKIQKETDSDK